MTNLFVIFKLKFKIIVCNCICFLFLYKLLSPVFVSFLNFDYLLNKVETIAFINYFTFKKSKVIKKCLDSSRKKIIY